MVEGIIFLLTAKKLSISSSNKRKLRVKPQEGPISTVKLIEQRVLNLILMLILTQVMRVRIICLVLNCRVILNLPSIWGIFIKMC